MAVEVDDKGDIPACMGDWIRSTEIRGRETQAEGRDGLRKSRSIQVIPKESHAWVKEIQGWEVDICGGTPKIFVDPPSRVLSFPAVKVGHL